MKAVQMSRFGGPEVLEIVEAPNPEPGAGELLVRAHAIGVNLAETLMRQDRYAVTPILPAIPGSEVAGVVERVGAGVDAFAVGQRVAAPLFASGRQLGGYAEFVVIEAAWAAPLPDALSFEAATALMIQGLTALHLTLQTPPAGKTALINAAAGGVGSLLLQLVKRAGAKRVIAAASTPKKLAFARSLGADVGLNYTQSNWADQLREETDGVGPEIVYKSVGGKVMDESLAALAPLGRIVVYGALNIQKFDLGVPELLQLIFKNQSLTGFAVAPLLTPANMRAALAELFDMAATGALTVTIGGRYPLERAAEAHRALEGRGTIGKVVVTP